eukprot:g10.t1
MKVIDLTKALNTSSSHHKPCVLVKGLLTKSECDDVLKSIEKEHTRPDDVSVEFHPGTRSTFYARKKELSGVINDRLKDWTPKILDGGKFVGLRHEFMFVRYYCNQSLFAHTDVRQTLVGDEKSTETRMSLTVYLDTDYEGGELAFVDGADIATDTMLFHGGGLKAVFDSYPEPKLVLRPSPGDAVIFYQNFPCYSHCVYPLKRGTKSIMRADFMYEFSKS